MIRQRVYGLFGQPGHPRECVGVYSCMATAALEGLKLLKADPWTYDWYDVLEYQLDRPPERIHGASNRLTNAKTMEAYRNIVQLEPSPFRLLLRTTEMGTGTIAEPPPEVMALWNPSPDLVETHDHRWQLVRWDQVPDFLMPPRRPSFAVDTPPALVADWYEENVGPRPAALLRELFVV